MIRVAFDLSGRGTNWLGGANYFRNLFLALSAGRHPFVPVALTGAREDAPAIGQVEVVRLPILDRRRGPWILRKALERVTGTDRLLDRALADHGVGLLSHGWALGPRARVPVLGWIPDFQHRHLPGFFGAGERARRDAVFRRTCRHARLVIVSSEHARSDLAAFCPEAAPKARVLRFVACSAGTQDAVPLPDLSARHRLPERWVYLPNQFWAHKDHATVVEALRILRERGRTVHVVSTGNPSDPKQPGTFPAVMAARRAAGIEDRLHVLGIVPFADVAALLRHAVALVNPSLFEGWSTTVEEAKALGKRAILSDLAVHREQAPRRAIYFPPRDAGALADALWQAWEAYDPAEDEAEARLAAETLPARRDAFAAAYAAIVAEALA